jgi:GntR family transcriptional regulator, rspAB operon transcriptional repressor
MTARPIPYDFLDRPAILPRGNVTTHVIQQLRRAIVTLALAPGTPIDKTAVCQRLGVSRFPVSEALARLQAEGLVDILPQRGTSVSRIRTSDVAEYMFMRKALESEAVRVLVENGPGSVMDDLSRALDEQRAAAAKGDRAAFHAGDCAFHEHLLVALQFSRIKTIIDSARANVDRARRLIQSPRRLALTIAEHSAILAAIEAGNADGAATAMRAHIDAVMDEFVSFAKSHPDLFANGGD